jgi:hypothetical protein
LQQLQQQIKGLQQTQREGDGSVIIHPKNLSKYLKKFDISINLEFK